MKKLQKRYLWDLISNSIEKRMVFIGGPRQVGKTTLCLQFIGSDLKKLPLAYLN